VRLKGNTRYYRNPGVRLEMLEGSGRDVFAISHVIRTASWPSTGLSMVLTQQYLIYIRGDALDEVTEQALHLTYFFLMRALQEHRRQGRNGEFEAFAVQILALLQQNRHLYTVDTSAEADTDLAAS